MTTRRDVPQNFNDELLGHVLISDGSGDPKPTVILIPTMMGVSDLELGFADELVGRGYSALVVDMFGIALRGSPRDTMLEEMNRLLPDRASLRDRLLAILAIAEDQAEVDPGKVSVIGFCFGGLCALDFARSGADIRGAASFHGLFTPTGLPANKIKAKVAAYHGWNDPLVPPEDVVALGNELTAAGCDWQIHAYGNVTHGFTNPKAAALQLDFVRYDEQAKLRSWASLERFLDECFG